jgi:glycerol-3-phosphate dehydrogenase subunit B
MSRDEPVFDCFVIGAGMAGMAAALFAAQRGLAVGLCGSVGGIDFSTGLIDLLGVHPVAEKKPWDDPFQALAALARDEPGHPYAKVGPDRIRTAIEAFTDFLNGAGIPYHGRDANCRLLSPAGTAKLTWRVPGSMWNGVLAMEERAPTLIVDFHGLKGFSGRQIAQVQQRHWPGLRSVLVRYPGFRGELYAEHLAMRLAEPGSRRTLAQVVAQHMNGEAYVAFPAALGLYGAADVQARLEDLLEARVFEIPTLPPSLAGLRLRAAFEQRLPRLPGARVAVYSQKMVRRCERLDGGDLRFHLSGMESTEPEFTIRARAAIHAGGRFFGKGLAADRKAVTEPVFDLPVRLLPGDPDGELDGREHWHRETFFDERGHPVNHAGLVTDDQLRPLGEDGRAALPNLFAAGSILAGQDWMRARCGAGLAIATAWAAVDALTEP